MSWKEEWPNSPGHYWFYGWDFGEKTAEKRLSLVEVYRGGNSLSYIANGHFIYKSEAIGLWQKAILPELPIEKR